jgi:hypothetical protein
VKNNITENKKSSKKHKKVKYFFMYHDLWNYKAKF